MTLHFLTNPNHRVARRALSLSRLVPALIFSILGLGFLIAPPIAGDFAQDGYAPAFRIALGWAHLVGGIALLVGAWADRASILLAVLVAAVTLCFHFGGVRHPVSVPAVLVGSLILFRVCSRIRSRILESDWNQMISRYGDQT